MTHNLIVIGAGAAGMMAAITAARRGSKVLLMEKLPKIGAKLKATGGGRCNLTNTLSNDAFMECFGREGRFMRDALSACSHEVLQAFFSDLGVPTHAPDGYRIFPVSHSALCVVQALEQEMRRLHITVRCAEAVVALEQENGVICGVQTQHERYRADAVVVATGGLGYPQLGAEGDGYTLAQKLGHTIKQVYPAMMPLHTKERWVAQCRADTVAKAELTVNLKGSKKLRAAGDLIFTKNGIRGPVVLDFSRDITPLLQCYGEVPLHVNLVQGKSETELHEYFKKRRQEYGHYSTLELLQTVLPESISRELCSMSAVDPLLGWNRQEGRRRDMLVRLMAKMPLTVVGHDGFAKAMITRGGIALKEIDPRTMQSKIVRGLYFCGEVMDLDGPCGGYNLQWSFASGFVAGLMRG